MKLTSLFAISTLTLSSFTALAQNEPAPAAPYDPSDWDCSHMDKSMAGHPYGPPQGPGPMMGQGPGPGRMMGQGPGPGMYGPRGGMPDMDQRQADMRRMMEQRQGSGPMMGRQMGPGPGRGGMMGPPQGMQERMEAMESHLANIEKLLQQMVDMQNTAQ